MTADGVIYPVTLYIAKARDGRNILYDANIKILEGISIDREATSERAKKQARQAVKVPKPSNKGNIPQPEDGVKASKENKEQSRSTEDFSNRMGRRKAVF